MHKSQWEVIKIIFNAQQLCRLYKVVWKTDQIVKYERQHLVCAVDFNLWKYKYAVKIIAATMTSLFIRVVRWDMYTLTDSIIE